MRTYAYDKFASGPNRTEMNPMTNVKNIKKLSEEELKRGNRTSWHDQYRGSAWIFVGGLPYDLTEGDIVCVFSQYGELVNVNLVRDKESGKSKGFCFICYEDQRSTDLAVDNFNGIKVLGRTIRVDHVENYKPPKSNRDENRAKTREIVKHKIKEERLTDEEDICTRDTAVEGKLPKKRNKKRLESESDSEDNDKRKRKKGSKKQKKRKNLEADHLSESEREKKRWKKQKLKPSSSTSSSSSSSATSPSSSDNDEVGTKIRKKHHKSLQLKTNRTIADLKREAKLIHAELKRRQRQEEQEKVHLDSGDEHRRKRDRKASR